MHVVGERDWPLYEEFKAANPLDEYASRYHPVAYLHETMPLALAAADLTVARAGASSIGEFPVAHLPAVLVPLPHAGVNQDANARLLAGRGAAVVVDDQRLEQELTPTVTGLLTDPTRLAEMTTAASGLAKPDAAAAIAEALRALQA